MIYYPLPDGRHRKCRIVGGPYLVLVGSLLNYYETAWVRPLELDPFEEAPRLPLEVPVFKLRADGGSSEIQGAFRAINGT